MQDATVNTCVESAYAFSDRSYNMMKHFHFLLSISTCAATSWAANTPGELATVIGKLEKVQSDFNKGRTGAAKVSLADVIVIGGRALHSFPPRQLNLTVRSSCTGVPVHTRRILFTGMTTRSLCVSPATWFVPETSRDATQRCSS